jgi:hypothetical protein
MHVAYNNSHPVEYQPSEPMSLEQILKCRNNLHDAVTKLTTPLGKGTISLHRVSLANLMCMVMTNRAQTLCSL